MTRATEVLSESRRETLSVQRKGERVILASALEDDTGALKVRKRIIIRAENIPALIAALESAQDES